MPGELHGIFHPRTEILLVFIGLLPVPSLISAYGEADTILQAAEGVFKAMKERRFEELWSLFAAKSHQTMADEIFKATVKAGGVASKQQISNDVATGGPTAQAYWRAKGAALDSGQGVTKKHSGDKSLTRSAKNCLL